MRGCAYWLDQRRTSWPSATTTSRSMHGAVLALKIFIVMRRTFAPVTTIRLEQNYRSTDVILKAANAVISNNTGRLGKELWTEQGAGTPIQLYAAFNEQDEARFVANRMSQHVDQGGLYGEQAILYRSNAQSRAFWKMHYYARAFPIAFTEASDSMSASRSKMH